MCNVSCWHQKWNTNCSEQDFWTNLLLYGGRVTFSFLVHMTWVLAYLLISWNFQVTCKKGFWWALKQRVDGKLKILSSVFQQDFWHLWSIFLKYVDVAPILILSVRQVVLCETEIVVPVFTTGGCKKRFCHLHFIFLVLQAFQAFRSTKFLPVMQL